MTANKPRICIVGAGAIGGFFAARLAHAGNDVSVLARGATLAAIRQQGLRLESGDERITARVRASDDTREFGLQDIVLIAVKSPSLAAIARHLSPLVGPDTIILPALNGIPWWFFLDPRHPLGGLRLRSVDADGSIEASIPLPNVVGIVVNASCSTPEPGLVRNAAGKRALFGETSGGQSARVDRLAALFGEAGLTTVASHDIRTEIWTKLLGNACFNPVSMITGSASDHMIDDPRLHAMFSRMMTEILALGTQIGIPLAISPQERIAATRQMGHIKTSMLQDLEARRPIELDSIVGVLIECAAAAGIAIPTLETVYALARRRAEAEGVYPTFQ